MIMNNHLYSYSKKHNFNKAGAQYPLGRCASPSGPLSTTLASEMRTMRFECKHVSASSAGDEIFQVLFDKVEDQYEEPYLLIQRAWLPENEGAFSPVYVETHDLDLIGHYTTVDAELTRNLLSLRLPASANGTIEVEFKTSDANFREVSRMLGIILQDKTIEYEDADANNTSELTSEGRADASPGGSST